MVEHCFICDEPTGRAGKADDSLYNENGEGPFCDVCWTDDVTKSETLRLRGLVKDAFNEGYMTGILEAQNMLCAIPTIGNKRWWDRSDAKKQLYSSTPQKE